jgi:hypothetical protein
MSDFFSSLKSDLLDKRFLPVLAVLGVALIAAVAYAVLGSGGSTTSTPSTPSPVSSATTVTKGSVTKGSVAITQAPENTSQAVAETTSGASKHSGSSRDPFTPLPEAKAKSASSSSSSAKSSSSSSSGGSSSSSGSSKSTSSSGGTTPTTPLKPVVTAKKIYIHYHVTAQFGVVPAPVAGAPAQPVQLKTYTDMPLNEPLPASEPQLVYVGVQLSNGKDAAFALTGAAILHGSATCKPSPTQCQAILLAPGQSETLEVVGATGQTTIYELKLVSVTKTVSESASTARAHGARAHTAGARGDSKVGRALVERAGLSGLYRHYATTETGSERSGK